MSAEIAQAIASLGGTCATPWPDCILWMGDTSRGYGKVRVDGVKKRAHRVVWERLNGPVPDGLELDHLCRVRNCVNPDHLEPVTRIENVRRARAVKGPITHCKRGHEFTPSNTIVKSSGRRNCRTCEHMRRRRALEARSAPAAPLLT